MGELPRQTTVAQDAMFLVRMGPPAKGDTIHRSTCMYAQKPNALRWAFADKNPDYDWHTGAPWLKRCQRCFPPSPFKDSGDA